MFVLGNPRCGNQKFMQSESVTQSLPLQWIISKCLSLHATPKKKKKKNVARKRVKCLAQEHNSDRSISIPTPILLSRLQLYSCSDFFFYSILSASHATYFKCCRCNGIATEGALLRTIRTFLFHVTLKVRSFDSLEAVVVGTTLPFCGAGRKVFLYGKEKQYELKR